MAGQIDTVKAYFCPGCENPSLIMDLMQYEGETRCPRCGTPTGYLDLGGDFELDDDDIDGRIPELEDTTDADETDTHTLADNEDLHEAVTGQPPTNNEDGDGGVLELDPQLTTHGDILKVAGLSVADTIPDQVDTQRYQASTLAAWADALADVEATVEVGLAPAPRDPPRNEDGDAPLALYAQIGDSQVVAFAAPMLPSLEDETAEDTDGGA